MTDIRPHSGIKPACRRSTPRRHQPTGSDGARSHGRSPAGDPGPLLTIAEVLAELQVARSTFDTWRSLGRAPECIKLPNGQLRIRRHALDSWLASRTEIAEVS